MYKDIRLSVGPFHGVSNAVTNSTIYTSENEGILEPNSLELGKKYDTVFVLFIISDWVFFKVNHSHVMPCCFQRGRTRSKSCKNAGTLKIDPDPTHLTSQPTTSLTTNPNLRRQEGQG